MNIISEFIDDVNQLAKFIFRQGCGEKQLSCLPAYGMGDFFWTTGRFGGLYDYYNTEDSCAGPTGITFKMQPINNMSSPLTLRFDMTRLPESRLEAESSG